MDTVSKTAALIVLTDSLYLPGTIKLLESFFEHNERLPAIALSRDPEVISDSRLLALTTRQLQIELEPYAEIRPYKKRHSHRHAETFFKFEAFQDFGYDRNIYLDSDLLCLRGTPHLLDFKNEALLAVRDSGFKPTRGYKGHSNEINSGVLSIPQSLIGTHTVRELQEIARTEPGRGGYNAGDQSIINKWIHRKQLPLVLLPEEYNLIKKDYNDTTRIESCRLLHYCDRKPWFPSNKSPSPLERIWQDSLIS